MNISSLRFGARLGLGFGTVLALMVAMAAFGTFRVSRIIDINHEIADKSQRYALAAAWRDDTRLNLTRTLAIAKSGNLPALDAYLKPQMAETSGQIAERQKQLQQAVTEAGDKDRLQAIGARRSAYMAVRDAVFAQMHAGDMNGALARIDADMIPASQAYLAAIEELEQSLQAGLQRANPLLEQNARETRNWLLALTAAALLAGGLIAAVITRSITAPMQRAIGATRLVAAGDLSQRLDAGTRADEVGQLENALAEMQQRLREVVSRIRAATDEVTTASGEIASGGQDLSARSEQAASNLQQTAASMEELTSTTRQTAATASRARELAGNATAVAAARRHRRGPGRRHDGGDQRGQPQDRRHHRRDRRHRLPDQHPGAQRRRRSGPRRRAGPRLRGRGRRGAHPGPAQRHRGARDQGTDRRLGRARSSRAAIR